MDQNASIDFGAWDTRKGAEQGFDLTLKAPDGTRLPGFRIRGYDSSTYQNALRAQRRRFMDQATRKRELAPEDVEAETNELVATLLIAWPDSFALDGKPFPYSPENALTLVARFPWAHEQIAGAAAVRENFLPKSSASS